MINFARGPNIGNTQYIGSMEGFPWECGSPGEPHDAGINVSYGNLTEWLSIVDAGVKLMAEIDCELG